MYVYIHSSLNDVQVSNVHTFSLKVESADNAKNYKVITDF